MSFLALFVLLTGCASSYKRINPHQLSYSNREVLADVEFSYKYGVLSERGNKKYAKKEESRAIKLIAIKLTNNAGETLDVQRDLKFYSGNNELTLMDPNEVRQVLKQTPAHYLPYLLLTFLTLNVNTESSSSSYPIGLVIGPGITIGNMLTASGANGKLLQELYEYDIRGRSIQKGETVYGIIGVRGVGFDPITIKKN